MISVLPVVLLLALQAGGPTGTTPVPDPASAQSATQSQSPDTSRSTPLRHVGGGVSAPVATYTVAPEYSKEARKRKMEGVTTISLIVSTQGLPVNIHILHSMAEKADKKHRAAALSLDQAALDAVAQYRFLPATENGKPVAVPLNVEVNFRLF